MKTSVLSTSTKETIFLTAMFAAWMALKRGSCGTSSQWMVQSFAFRPSVRQQRRATSSALSAKKAAGGGDKKPQNPFASTIILPETGFSQRANAVVREPEIQQFWNDYDLYHKLSEQAEAADAPRFVLHDGPPYANGDLHCGHALNKILKDFINRKQALNGKQVHYVPGWDCHGLPIELKVLQNMKSKEREGLTPVTLREKAASFAKETVEKQSQAFQRYGIFGDFEHPYLTLDPKFEAAQIRVFGEMFQKGFIFRGRKPVHWSPSSRTALAEAELEYPDNHVSKSIYVAFEVVEASDALKDYHSDESPVKVAVWTTTPWTMPANLAVAVNPELSYSVVNHVKTGKLVVATDLMDTIAKKLELPDEESFEVLVTMKGSELIGTSYTHPLYDRKSPVLAGGDYITTESGTGLVHTAPGHGQEDYQTGLKNGLELLSPVDDVGKFTIEAGEEFVGLSVLGEGNQAIIDALKSEGALLKAEDYGHKYPYDWRTKQPTIFRATDQWFASVEGFRDAAIKAIDTVQWVPDVGKNRINAFVSGRGDWCISRQRSWGVPIPVFYDRETGKEVLLNDSTLNHIEKVFAEQGSDAWWKLEEKDLLPEEYKDEADKWKKGTDTMDVWFDSGSSWAGVASAREELRYPADMYLEGSDQHRGWFQSSLLTSVAVNEQAPYKTVLTHGFVLDEKGFKMSKSLGNVINPSQIIEGGNNKKQEPAYGADVLRLWVASVDYSGDVNIGPNIIKQTFESYRKLRNTARYLIGNLADFVPEGEPGSTAVPYDELPSLDKWMLGRLGSVLREVDEAMNEFQFQRAVQELLRFTSAEMSNFYLDVAKDRLYISATDDFRRRSCQTVIQALLEGFAKAVAPILPHMAEDIWQNLPYATSSKSVFEGGWPSHLAMLKEHGSEKWELVRQVRDDVNKMLEVARSDKLVGASLDAAAFLYVEDDDKRKTLESLVGDENLIVPPIKTNGVDELRTVLMLSQVHIMDSAESISSSCNEKYISTSETSSGCIVGVSKAAGQKCGRCWFYDTNVGNHDHPHSDVCQRCNDAISSWEKTTGQTFVRPAITEEEQQPVA
ncbi:isoleucyl-tRNA synthetase [Nitzschia inconspicua]|uniref:isoleucine--tRNA ligase n=1 Tax=Nitzschia inconspicua TaxID=303405 RepID=A0A9K3PUT2_9STRA|nr:isoleucyl-tRNA synthetase [Nitzschia inconspicua]